MWCECVQRLRRMLRRVDATRAARAARARASRVQACESRERVARAGRARVPCAPTCEELCDDGSERPDVDLLSVGQAEHNLWRAVAARLHVRREVVRAEAR
eukprot:6174871-Pleurochrysis_carterae.AAC.1